MSLNISAFDFQTQLQEGKVRRRGEKEKGKEILEATSAKPNDRSHKYKIRVGRHCIVKRCAGCCCYESHQVYYTSGTWCSCRRPSEALCSFRYKDAITTERTWILSSEIVHTQSNSYIIMILSHNTVTFNLQNSLNKKKVNRVTVLHKIFRMDLIFRSAVHKGTLAMKTY